MDCGMKQVADSKALERIRREVEREYSGALAFNSKNGRRNSNLC